MKLPVSLHLGPEGPLHWKRYNKQAILFVLYWQADGLELVSFYCRAVDSFVIRGVRMYVVKPCDSILGEMGHQSFVFPAIVLRDTGRRISKEKRKRGA